MFNVYDDGPLREAVDKMRERLSKSKAKLEEQEEKRTRLAKLEAQKIELERTLSEQKLYMTAQEKKHKELIQKINDLRIREKKAEAVISHEDSKTLKKAFEELNAYKVLTGITWDLESCSEKILAGSVADPITLKVIPFQVDQSEENASEKIISAISKSCI